MQSYLKGSIIDFSVINRSAFVDKEALVLFLY